MGGITNGERAILTRQLARKFGSLSPEALAVIDRAEPAELEKWADRVLTASTLAEVLDEAP